MWRHSRSTGEGPIWLQTRWRRGRDLNPRQSFWPCDGLANRCLRPLGHLSTELVGRALSLPPLLSCLAHGSQGKSRKARTPGVAEGVGFEPTEGTRPSTAFKAAAFVHSATPPPSHPPTPGPPRRTLVPWLVATRSFDQMRRDTQYHK